MTGTLPHIGDQSRNASGIIAGFAQAVTLLAIGSYFLVPYYPSGLPYFFGRPVFVTQLLIVTALIAWCVAILRNPERMRVFPRRLLPAALALLVSFAILTVSTLIRGDFSYTAFSRVVSLVAIASTTLISFFLDRVHLNIFFRICAHVSIAASAIGIMQFFFFEDALAPAAYFGYAHTTFYAVGFANYSSVFAASLALFLPLFFAFAARGHDERRVLWTTAFIMGSAALTLTFSRSSLLGASVGLLSVIWWHISQKTDTRRIGALLACAAFVVVGALLFNPPEKWESNALHYRANASAIYRDRFSFVTRPVCVSCDTEYDGPEVPLQSIDYSAYSRYIFYVVGTRMIADSLPSALFGYGLRGFIDQWDRFKGTITGPNRLDPHSLYLEIAVSGGLLALSFFIAFLYFLYRAAWENRMRNEAIVPLLCGITAFLIDSLLHTHLYTKYLWIALGVLSALISLTIQEKQQSMPVQEK